jgi:hypothetical protein
MARVCNVWLSKAANYHSVEIVLCADSGPAALHASDVVAALQRKGVNALFVENSTGNNDCVTGWNLAAAAARGRVLISVADDFNPPIAWDAHLLSLAPFSWWDGEYVVAVADGYNPDIFTLAILTSVRYQRFGYMFYPEYKSLFSDTEFTAVANLEGCVIDARHLVFEHMHPDCNKRNRDSVDLHHASAQRWNEGETLFNWRKERGFPVDCDGTERPVYTVFVLAIKDDFCLEEVITRVIESASVYHIPIKAVNVFTPAQYWSGVATPAEHVKEVVDVVARLTKLGTVPINHYIGNVQFEGCANRIEVETAFRNHCLATCRKQSNHTLVVDGDELWSSDFIKKLDDFVQLRRPASVYTGMLPVVGLPGYPVDKAKDKATVYVANFSFFAICRGCAGLRHEIPGYDVIHFTATRRTLQEIVDKHINSGHADDPDYDMRGWIDNVLLKNKLVPGFRNAHMYKKYQIWELIRHFTPDEISQIPSSIKKYLGC